MARNRGQPAILTIGSFYGIWIANEDLYIRKMVGKQTFAFYRGVDLQLLATSNSTWHT